MKKGGEKRRSCETEEGCKARPQNRKGGEKTRNFGRKSRGSPVNTGKKKGPPQRKLIRTEEGGRGPTGGTEKKKLERQKAPRFMWSPGLSRDIRKKKGHAQLLQESRGKNIKRGKAHRGGRKKKKKKETKTQRKSLSRKLEECRERANKFGKIGG